MPVTWNGRNGCIAALADTGSFANLMGELVAKDCKLKIQPTNLSVTGINSNTHAIGEVRLDIWIGQAHFPGSIWYVMPSLPIPLILGRDLHRRCSNINWNMQQKTITFVSPKHTVLVPYINKPNEEEFKVPTVETTFLTINKRNLASHSQSELLTYLHEQYGIELNGDHGNAEELRSMTEVLMKHEHVFACDDRPIGEFNAFKARLNTEPGKTMYVPQYRIPERFEKPIQKELDTMLKAGVIQKCPQNRSWNTPIGAVEKKCGAIRLICNYKLTLNKILCDEDTFSIPSLEEETVNIGPNNRYFGTMDVKNGYLNIGIHDDDQHKTSFFYKNQNFMFTRWPFGCRTSGAVFCRAIHHALRNVANKNNIKVFIDDICIHAETYAEFLATVDQVLGALDEHGFTLSGKKVHFLTPEVKWLGRIVGPDGVKPDPTNVQGINAIQPPRTMKQLQSLIGALNWIRSFASIKLGERIKENTFSDLSKPITRLLRNKDKFKWTEEANNALIQIKEKLASPDVIHFPDYTQTFYLTTDASLHAVGFALMQNVDDKARLIRVGSRTLTDAQTRWSTIEREAYGILYAIKDCEYYLKGRKFILKTDHKPLIFMDMKVSKNAKVARWTDYLSGFQFLVQYLPGKDNQLADFFSRQPHDKMEKKPEQENAVAGNFEKYGAFQLYIPSWVSKEGTKIPRNDGDDITSGYNIVAVALGKDCQDEEISEYTTIVQAQYDDAACRLIIDALQHGYPPNLNDDDEEQKALKSWYKRCTLNEKSGALEISGRAYIPRNLRAQILRTYHEERDHIAAQNMKLALKHVFWPKQLTDIVNYVKSCNCNHNKGGYGRPHRPETGHVKRGNQPFEIMQMDFIELPVSTNGYHYALTCMCTFSRFLIAIPLRRNRAIDAARALSDNLFNTYEIPKEISSDRGTHFNAALMKEFAELYGVTMKIHVAWRPQSTGQLERAHRTLKNCIYVVQHERRAQWDTIIKPIVRIMNCTPNSATKVSPHFAVFGKQPRVSQFDENQPEQNRTMDEHLLENRKALEEIHKNIRVCQMEADKRVEKQLDPKVQAELIETGDQILLYRPHSAMAKRSKCKWIGPYDVIATNDRVIKIADDEGKSDWVHRSHVCLKPKRPSHLGEPLPFIPMAPTFRNVGPVNPAPPRQLIAPTEEPMVEDQAEEPAEPTAEVNDIEPTVDNDITEETIPDVQEDPQMIDDIASHELIQQLVQQESPRRSSRLNPERTSTRSSSRTRRQTPRFQANHTGNSHNPFAALTKNPIS